MLGRRIRDQSGLKTFETIIKDIEKDFINTDIKTENTVVRQF